MLLKQIALGLRNVALLGYKYPVRGKDFGEGFLDPVQFPVPRRWFFSGTASVCGVQNCLAIGILFAMPGLRPWTESVVSS